MSLEKVAHSLKDLTTKKKEIEKEEKDLRSALFSFGVLDYADRDYLLPTTTVTVPHEFFDSTGLSEEDFLDRSFPTWDMINRERDDIAQWTTYVLRKNPLYMPFSYEDDDMKLSKTVVEPTPEIDLETLKAEKPELFKKITARKVVVVLDGDKLQEELENNDELTSILMRHTKHVRQSQQRVGFKDGN